MSDIEALLAQAVPAIGTAAGICGTAVLSRAGDEAGGAAAGLGRRLLGRILDRARDPAPVRTAVTALTEPAENPDALPALRFHLRQLLTEDPELRAELASLLAPAPHGGISVGGDNTGIVSSGDGATNIQVR